MQDNTDAIDVRTAWISLFTTPRDMNWNVGGESGCGTRHMLCQRNGFAHFQEA